MKRYTIQSTESIYKNNKALKINLCIFKPKIKKIFSTINMQ